TTVESVASFSIVLGEAFAALALSTLVPASFVTITRGAKAALKAATTPDAAASAQSSAEGAITSIVGASSPMNKTLAQVIKGATADTGIDLLIPKTAHLHADFEFQGSEAMSVHGEVGGMIEMVTVKAGMSALYTSSSKNRVTIDVDFATVHY